jgi:hypothetical protein
MDYEWAKKCAHVNFGMVMQSEEAMQSDTKLTSCTTTTTTTTTTKPKVNGMSTRKGTAVFLEDILDDAKSVMAAKMAEVGCLRIALLRRRSLFHVVVARMPKSLPKWRIPISLPIWLA